MMNFDEGQKVALMGSGRRGVFQKRNNALVKNEVLVNGQMEYWGINETLPAPPKGEVVHIEQKPNPLRPPIPPGFNPFSHGR